jgi:5'(3')-deoxyribonucleotidase
LINFVGNKNSGLYYFYLVSQQVPLCYHKNLFWKDYLVISALLNNFIRYLSEFFILFGNPLQANISFNYDESDEKEYQIISKINVEGKGLFSFYKNVFNGEIFVDSSSNIKTFQFYKGNKVYFKATNILEKKNQNE